MHMHMHCVQISVLSLCILDLLPDDQGALSASGKAWVVGPAFLAARFNVFVCNDEMWHSPCQKGEGRLSLTFELAGGRIISFKMKMLMACCHSEGICCFFPAVLMSFHILTTVLVQLVVWPQELMTSLPFLMTSCRLGGEVSNGKHSGVGCNTYPGEPIGMALAVSRCSILMWYSSSLLWCQSFHY